MNQESEKKVVSPFEFAIISIAEPEKINEYREETEQERKDKIENKIRNFYSCVKNNNNENNI